LRFSRYVLPTAKHKNRRDTHQSSVAELTDAPPGTLVSRMYKVW